jgi:lysophospholipase L1-like esterase
MRPPPRLEAFVLAVAMLASACDVVDGIRSPAGPSPIGPPAPNQPVHYTAIGASDVIGIGSSVICAPFIDCPQGTGYVFVVARQLRASRTVEVTNLGIPAGVVSRRIESIGQRHGRQIPGNLLDRAVPTVPRASTVVTILAGGNDVNAIGDAAQSGDAGNDVRGYINGQINEFASDFQRLVAETRARATGAYIVILNLPNMAALPYAAGYSAIQRQGLQALAVGFSRAMNRQGGNGVAVVDLMCDAQMYDRSNYSSDGFHPNDAGYAHIARRILSVLDGQLSTPAESCAPMTAFPPL